MSERLPISAFVASHNEASLLGRCLDSIAFCDDVVVIDIASDDDTAEVAAAHGARVLEHPLVPIAERARMNLVGEARHDWLLFLDPDEIFAPVLARQLGDLLPRLADDVAVIVCPRQFHFRGRPLRGTVWGGVREKRTLARRGGADLRPTVHSGTRPRDGFRTQEIPYTGDNAIAHYWASGYRELLRKHRRYLALEGPDRYSQGLVTGIRDILGTPVPAFWESFVADRGYADGSTGLLLSVLWAAYSTGAKISLLRELRNHGAEAAS